LKKLAGEGDTGGEEKLITNVNGTKKSDSNDTY
jgi:hypothetical protein